MNFILRHLKRQRQQSDFWFKVKVYKNRRDVGFVSFLLCLLLLLSMFLAVEGNMVSGGRAKPPKMFIVKELTIIYNDMGEYEHFMFDTPTDVYPTPNDWKTINFATKHLHQLKWVDSSLLPYKTVAEIFKQLTADVIYVAGNITHDYVKTMVPNANIVDVCTVFDFKYPKTLPDSHCFRRHNPRHCSKAKAFYIKKTIGNLLKS